MIGPKSSRITIVLPAAVLESLKAQADAQGRSMSNLASVLLQEAFGKLGRRDG
jgi:hypothetical protein